MINMIVPQHTCDIAGSKIRRPQRTGVVQPILSIGKLQQHATPVSDIHKRANHRIIVLPTGHLRRQPPPQHQPSKTKHHHRDTSSTQSPRHQTKQQPCIKKRQRKIARPSRPSVTPALCLKRFHNRFDQPQVSVTSIPQHARCRTKQPTDHQRAHSSIQRQRNRQQ